MKRFCFTVDDNIRCLRHLTEQRPASMFDLPYFGFYRRLHEKYGLKVQLNLFYEEGDFNLSLVTDAYRDEWEANADWLKLSFHSKSEWPARPYEFSGYDEVFADCSAVNREILRFAGEKSLAKTTTVHYCRNTADGLRALRDCGVEGLLGLFGTEESPRTSYEVTEEHLPAIRRSETVVFREIAMGSLDVILNECRPDVAHARVEALLDRENAHIMTHEQHYYPDRSGHSYEFEPKTEDAVALLCENGFAPAFFEEMMQ